MVRKLNALAAAGCLLAATSLSAQTSRLDVRLDTEEADAVLALVELGKRATESDWKRLFESEGYRRLKQREASLNRAFTDSSFRAFVADPALKARAPRLKEALEAWRTISLEGAARLAFAYLPDSARIRATIYPSIKPRTNTFVFEPNTNPAIFFYLDPGITAAQFENTLAHELHHLGTGAVCKNRSELPVVQQWMGGFSEGRAVLAAAGDPDVHPHQHSSATDRQVWERDYQKVPADMRRLEQFFLDLMGGRLTDEQQNQRGFQFVSTDSVPQGAFYTVGYHMARAVEKGLGRDRLVASLCDPRRFVEDYQRAAAAQDLPRWSSAFLARLGASGR
jgi:hypothetical protein